MNRKLIFLLGIGGLVNGFIFTSRIAAQCREAPAQRIKVEEKEAEEIKNHLADQTKKDIQTQLIKPFIRTGFTVVEWGGTQLTDM